MTLENGKHKEVVCPRCLGADWVCDAHPSVPFGLQYPGGCVCVGNGRPCPLCSPMAHDTTWTDPARS